MSHMGGYGQICPARKAECLRARRQCPFPITTPNYLSRIHAPLHQFIATYGKQESLSYESITMIRCHDKPHMTIFVSTYLALHCQGYPSAQGTLTKACIHQVAVSDGAQAPSGPVVRPVVGSRKPALLSSLGHVTCHLHPQLPTHPCRTSDLLHTACTCTSCL